MQTEYGYPDATIDFSPQPQAIVFYAGGKEALRITKEGVTADPTIPVDEAAKAVLQALDAQIRALR